MRGLWGNGRGDKRSHASASATVVTVAAADSVASVLRREAAVSVPDAGPASGSGFASDRYADPAD